MKRKKKKKMEREGEKMDRERIQGSGLPERQELGRRMGGGTNGPSLPLRSVFVATPRFMPSF